MFECFDRKFVSQRIRDDTGGATKLEEILIAGGHISLQSVIDAVGTVQAIPGFPDEIFNS